MYFRALFVITLIVVVVSSSAAQSCEACNSRTVILYDVAVPYPAPAGPSDALTRWLNFHTLATGVRLYITAIDATRECLIPIDATSSPGTDSSHYPTLPSLPGDDALAPLVSMDYVMYGEVSGAVSQTFTLTLATAKSKEIVKTNAVPIPAGFDPFVIGNLATAGIGPLYTTIMDFEKSKRNGGEPYAIQPVIELTPEKTKLNADEKTTIAIVAKDCDGAVLPQRHIDLRVVGGTLDVSSVTTDGEGKASVQFTAGATPGIGSVKVNFGYTRPTGDTDSAKVQPALIQIAKPNDQWYFTGVFTQKTSSTMKRIEPHGGAAGTEDTYRRIYVWAYLENIYPYVSSFVSGPVPPYLHILAMTNGNATFHSFTDGMPAGYTDSRSASFYRGGGYRYGGATVDVRVNSALCHVGVSMVKIVPEGGGKRIYKNYELIRGTWQTETTDILPPGTLNLAMPVDTYARDSTFTATWSDVSGGITTTTTRKLTQKSSWSLVNSLFNLDYHLYEAEDKQDPALQENSNSVLQYDITATLSASGNTTDVLTDPSIPLPAEVLLEQNYPNPFNPATTIGFDLPRRSHVTLTVFDMLGRKVADLVDGLIEQGSHVVLFDGSHLASGVYLYRLETEGSTQTKQLSLIK